MTTALSTAAYLPDVMALEVGYVGRFARGGGLEDLAQAPYDIGSAREHYVRYAYDQARAPDGGIVAAPSDIGPGTLLYRHDLLERAGLAERDLTRDWEGYVDAGVRLKRTTGAYLLAHARDMKDIAIRTGVGPGEGLYFDRDARVLVTTPRFVRAFELARRVRAERLDARVAAWSNEWAEGFRRGTLATQLSGAWLAGHLSHWLAPDTRGRWRAAQLPEGAWAAYGGSFLAIPRGLAPERKALAWDLIRLLTLDRAVQLAAFKAEDAFPALRDAHDDPFFDEPLPFLGGQPARALWRDAARRITAVEVHKQDAFASEVVDTELDKVLDRSKPIAVALADARQLLEQRARR
jgi:multiple sugar transport system substrate-binding protein